MNPTSIFAQVGKLFARFCMHGDGLTVVLWIVGVIVVIAVACAIFRELCE